jgi:uncharacterized protein (DUF111 family)
MRISADGYGAGSRDQGPLPNMLRVLIGQEQDESTADTVIELSCNIDDCTGEVLGGSIETLLDSGCLDAWIIPVYTKKNRPAWLLTALCPPEKAEAVEKTIFECTTTFGIRKRNITRSKLDRSIETVETPYGPIRIKTGRLGNSIVTVSPEYADCRTAAESHNATVRQVILAARMAAEWNSQ